MQQVGRDYGVEAIPQNTFIDRQGRIYASLVGGDPELLEKAIKGVLAVR